MSLLEINWHPQPKELRSFGKIALIASALIALVLYVVKGLALFWALPIIALGLLIFLSSIVSVKLTRVIYLSLVLLTLPIGWVVSFIVLTAFYFLLITPVALVFRLIGRDPLHRRFDAAAKSYWLKRNPPQDLDHYFHQFR